MFIYNNYNIYIIIYNYIYNVRSKVPLYVDKQYWSGHTHMTPT